jgi:hypothetical protein
MEESGRFPPCGVVSEMGLGCVHVVGEKNERGVKKCSMV